MRFAYIDSNGNEVPIPSVDALALRIELGAINEETELYDAQADQWGPAHTHEIFHTLSRAAEEGDQGFVAPPPPVPPPPAAEPEPDATEPEPVSEAPEPPPEVEAPTEPEPATEEAEAAHDDAEDAVGELTLADAPPPPPPSEDDAEDSALLDLSPVDQALTETAPADLVAATDPLAEADDGAAFDFGDLSGGLEVEASSGGAQADEPAMDFGIGADEGGFGGALEQEMQFSAEGLGGADASAPLDLEQPMSDFSPEAPPAWMEPEDAADGGGDVMDFSSISADASPDEVAGDVPKRRAPKDKPSRPKFKRQRNLVGPIVGVVVLAAIGVGGYVAWPIVSAQLANRGAPDDTQAQMPPIPDELLPRMRALADAAFAGAFVEARASVGGGMARPPQNWLAGRYFGNASEFAEVETFWSDVQDQLDAVSAIDAAAFRAAYERAMDADGVTATDRTVLLERAEAGFSAAEREREDAFDLAQELVDAALGLHAFLVANEANIDYAPAASITSDPVLEARPSTPEIGAAMRQRIDDVTGSLDALDYLDVVTMEGLWGAVLARVQEVGIR